MINSLQGILQRNVGEKLSNNRMKQLSENHVAPLLAGQDDLMLTGLISKESIDQERGSDDLLDPHDGASRPVLRGAGGLEF